MKLKKYLTESRIPSIDKRIMIDIIRSGAVDKNYTIKLTDGTKVRVLKGNKKSPMTLIYPADKVDVTDALVDIIDLDSNLDFISGVKNEIQKFEVRYI